MEGLRSLERMTILKFYFPKVELLGQFSARSLTHFRIVVGENFGRIMSRLPRDVEFKLERWDRYLKYVHREGALEDETKVLRQADAFFLDRHIYLEKFSDFGKEILEQLKCCVLGECYKLRVLIDVEDFKEEGDGITLGSLEYLCPLYEELGDHLEGSYTEGKFILSEVPHPTDVSAFSLENLRKLEDLTVEDCPGLVSLVGREHRAPSQTSYCLPILRKMSLHCLPQLTSISSG